MEMRNFENGQHLHNDESPVIQECFINEFTPSPLLPTCHPNHLHWCTFEYGQLGSGVRRQVHAVI